MALKFKKIQVQKYKKTGHKGLFDEQEKVIDKYKMNNKVHEKGYRNKPLSDERKANNKKKSKTRARVEHVFCFTCLPAVRWNKA